MHLYLLQHGEALSKELDPERPLSAQGRQDIEALGVLLAASSVNIDRLYHSGKARAVQSAEIITTALRLTNRANTLPGIAPNDPVDPVAEQVSAWGVDTLLVGHQPFLGRLAARLCCGVGGYAEFCFRPGTCIGLERRADDASTWALLFMVPPSLSTA